MQPSNKVTVLTAGGAGLSKPPPKRSIDKHKGDAASSPVQSENRPVNSNESEDEVKTLELEHTDDAEDTDAGMDHDHQHTLQPYSDSNPQLQQASSVTFPSQPPVPPPSSSSLQHHYPKAQTTELIWLAVCFFGIMASFVCYGLLLEYTTSGGRQLHELSFLFVTSGLYTITAAAGRYVRDETPTTIPPARFAVLGLTSMGSTFCSVRSLR